MRKVLTQEFFDRPTLKAAKELLGKYLVRRYRGRETAYMIVETEAYDGFRDKASHAHRRKTARNEIMFGKAGYFYVYFTYGMHYMLNIVTGEEGYPAAVLIRGVESANWRINGPGRLTRELRITKLQNKKPIAKTTGLWVEDRGVVIAAKDITRTPRVGVSYAEEWQYKPYRFVLKKGKTQPWSA